MVAYPTSPLLLEINMKWLANPNRDHSHFPHKFWSSYEYLIKYRNKDSCAKAASTTIPVETSGWIPSTSGICRIMSVLELLLVPRLTDYEPLNYEGRLNMNISKRKFGGVFECSDPEDFWAQPAKIRPFTTSTRFCQDLTACKLVAIDLNRPISYIFFPSAG